MIVKGKKVKVLYPEYARGVIGTVEDRDETGSWLICLDYPPQSDRLQGTNSSDNSWLLSLEESDFELL
ncbi:MAG: hypothetical protein AAGF83_13795 [Cyanobacteria bacterium P01_G01_bin.67]